MVPDGWEDSINTAPAGSVTEIRQPWPSIIAGIADLRWYREVIPPLFREVVRSSGAFDPLGLMKQIVQRNRIVPLFPIDTDCPEQSCSVLGRFSQYGARWNCYANPTTLGFVVYRWDRCFETVSRHCHAMLAGGAVWLNSVPESA